MKEIREAWTEDPSMPSLPLPGAEKQVYKPFGWGATSREPLPQVAFEVRKLQSSTPYWESKILPYAQLRPWDLVSDQFLLLPTAEFFITLSGEGLHTLVTPLRRQYVEFIQLYHPDYFHAPEPGVPVIREARIDVRGN